MTPRPTQTGSTPQIMQGVGSLRSSSTVTLEEPPTMKPFLPRWVRAGVTFLRRGTPVIKRGGGGWFLLFFADWLMTDDKSEILQPPTFYGKSYRS